METVYFVAFLMSSWIAEDYSCVIFPTKTEEPKNLNEVIKIGKQLAPYCLKHISRHLSFLHQYM